MKYARRLLLGLLFYILLAPALRAQVEIFPYAGIGWGQPLAVSVPDLYELRSERGSWQIGADVLIGGRALAPLVGIALGEARGRSELIPGPNFNVACDCIIDDPSQRNFLLPAAGVAYRLQPAAYSFNLLLVAAVAANVDLREGETGILPRLGAKFTVDFVVLSLDYYPELREDEAYENQYPSRLALSLGVRF